MTSVLERRSWKATILGSMAGIAALILALVAYIRPPEAGGSTSGPAISNSGPSAVIVQGNGNTTNVHVNEGRNAPRRFGDISVDDIKVETGTRDHKVHYPRIRGGFNPDAIARANHLLKRNALTPYERYGGAREIEIDYVIGFQEFNLLGVNFNVFVFADSAAHPLTTTAATVIDLETGNQFGLKDVFRPGFHGRLNGIVEEKLKGSGQYFPCVRERRASREDREANKFVEKALEEAVGHEAPTCFSSVRNTTQFYLTDTSLVLVFPKYSIAPGVAGDIEVPINFSDLKDLLRPQGPLHRFL